MINRQDCPLFLTGLTVDVTTTYGATVLHACALTGNVNSLNFFTFYQGVDFISTAILFFIATLSVNILGKEFSINGFTTLESIFIIFVSVVIFYGLYVYIIRLTEAEYYTLQDTNKNDIEKQKNG